MARVVAVSGGGTGNGYAVAEEFAGSGDQVVLTGRRAEVLGGAAAGLAAAHPAAPPALAVAADPARHWEANIRANTLTAVLLTEGLKERLATPGGRVVPISSIAAVCGSGNGSYGGAKAALHPRPTTWRRSSGRAASR